MAKNLICDLWKPACGDICNHKQSARRSRSCFCNLNLVISISFDRRNLRRQLLYFTVQCSHLSAKLVHVKAKNIRSIHTIQQYAHGIPRKVRYASRTCDQTNPFESQVLLFGEPDADHAGARFQN